MFDFSRVGYLPILSPRPAEMRALEELPSGTKDAMLPLFQLRPWVAAHRLESALARIEEAYQKRPMVVALGYPDVITSARPVHDELEALRDPARGYQNWCDFIEQRENYIPAVQFGDVGNQAAQISALYALDRGVVAVIERPGFAGLALVAKSIARLTHSGYGVLFILDFQRASRDHLQVAASAAGYIDTIWKAAPRAAISISASSFPDDFKGIPDQPIYERRLYDEVAAVLGNRPLIYSDRGSARVERNTGGGGTPSPRIDYPLRDEWKFYRSDDEVGFDGYFREARRLLIDPVWDPTLRVWGTQMIERTASGDSSAISNPNRSTAARINIHLQVQTFYNDPGRARETDEDWEG